MPIYCHVPLPLQIRGRALRALADTLSPKADMPVPLEASWLMVSCQFTPAPCSAGSSAWPSQLAADAWNCPLLSACLQDALMLDSLQEVQQLAAMHGYGTAVQDGTPVVLLVKVRRGGVAANGGLALVLHQPRFIPCLQPFFVCRERTWTRRRRCRASAAS